MPQQYTQFEGAFRDGSQPHDSYQRNDVEQPSVSPIVPASPPLTSSVNMPVQKPQVPARHSGETASSAWARVFLAIVSMLFVAGMFLVALVMSSLHDPVNNGASVLAILFAFVFAVLVVIINLIVNRRH